MQWQKLHCSARCNNKSSIHSLKPAISQDSPLRTEVLSVGISTAHRRVWLCENGAHLPSLSPGHGSCDVVKIMILRVALVEAPSSIWLAVKRPSLRESAGLSSKLPIFSSNFSTPVTPFSLRVERSQESLYPFDVMGLGLKAVSMKCRWKEYFPLLLAPCVLEQMPGQLVALCLDSNL